MIVAIIEKNEAYVRMLRNYAYSTTMKERKEFLIHNNRLNGILFNRRQDVSQGILEAAFFQRFLAVGVTDRELACQGLEEEFVPSVLGLKNKQNVRTRMRVSRRAEFKIHESERCDF